MKKVGILCLFIALLAFSSASITKECAEDIQDLIPLVQEVVSGLETRDFDEVFEKVVAAIPEIEETAKECLGVSAPLEISSNSCLDNLKIVLPELITLVEDATSGNFMKLGEDYIAYAQDIAAAAQACGFGSRMRLGTISDQCKYAIGYMQTDMRKVVTELESKEWSAVQTGMVNMDTDVNYALEECPSQATVQESCVNALQAFGFFVFEEISEGGLAKILQDFEEVVDNAESAFGSCFEIQKGAEPSTIGTMDDQCYDDYVNHLQDYYKCVQSAQKDSLTTFETVVAPYSSEFINIFNECRRRD